MWSLPAYLTCELVVPFLCSSARSSGSFNNFSAASASAQHSSFALHVKQPISVPRQTPVPALSNVSPSREERGDF